MNAHFFDIETILVNDSKVWIVDKKYPKIHIMKIDQSDFNLIRSGIYKSQNNKVVFSGKNYWFPDNLMEALKIKCKLNKTDISDLAFSMREFMDDEIIDNINYDINMDNLIHIKNTTDDIYLICSENTKSNYEKIIKKIENKLEENGLIIKKYFFISETFYSRDSDEISFKKIRLLLQYLIGLKTSGDMFIDEELETYNNIYFYDTDISTIKLAIDVNKMLELLINNSDSDIKSKIKEVLKNINHYLFVNLVTPNKMNRFSTTKVKIEYHNLIKTFEKFNWKK